MIPLPPGFQINAALLGAGLLIGASASWYLTAEYKDKSWQASVNAVNIEAERVLRKSIEAAHEVEMHQQKLLSDLEVSHAKDVQDLARIGDTNRALSARLGGMRDPGRRPSCPSHVPQEAGAADVPSGGSTSANLSAEAEEFLHQFAADADRAASYARKCKDATAINFAPPDVHSTEDGSTPDSLDAISTPHLGEDTPRRK